MMTSSTKIWLLLLLTAASLIVVFLLPPIPQPAVFHDFADRRTILGIPNMLNVASNMGFLFVGIRGLLLLRGNTGGIRILFLVLFAGVILTGLGSAYYHAAPSNERLIWDRMPMSIVFMSLLSVVVSMVVSGRGGRLLLWPLVLVGVGSCLWWYYTESCGFGDLRLFFFVQFYPMVIIPVMLLLYRSRVSRALIRCLAAVILWYVIAKLAERWDREIYSFLPVSGHTLKHLAAAISTWYFVGLARMSYSPRV